jgi:hypothetical protein
MVSFIVAMGNLEKKKKNKFFIAFQNVKKSVMMVIKTKILQCAIRMLSLWKHKTLMEMRIWELWKT